MELILVASVIGFIALFVVIPAVWSKDPDRRAWPESACKSTDDGGGLNAQPTLGLRKRPTLLNSAIQTEEDHERWFG